MLPQKLKDMNLFNVGAAEAYLGEVGEVNLPTLKRLKEAVRTAGMGGPVKADNGVDEIELEWTAGGYLRGVLRQFGIVKVDGVQLRFVGAYQRPDGEGYSAVEVVVRGTHEEIGMGKQKVGDDQEFKVKTVCSYYKLMIEGRVEIEIDLLKGVEIVDGVDRRVEIRAIIGA